MRSILIIFGIFFILTRFSLAQEQKSCCSTGNEKTKISFTSFGKDEDFRNSHQLPNNRALTNPEGTMIKFPTPGGTEANAYFVKSENKSNKYILMIHEWWGLNNNIKREADKLKTNLGDVNVLALDLYDGKSATTREAAGELMQSANPERIRKIFDGAVQFAGKNAEFGTIGWCFGGGWSLQMSIWLADKGKACVMYYGIIENTPETFKELKAPVLGIFAKQDDWINPELYGNLEENLKEAGKSVVIKEYDADHAFANPSNEVFDEEASEDAMRHSIDFLRKYLLNKGE